MAACTSNFTHEVQEFEDYIGESDNKIKYNSCQKNPGHENFKSVCNLKMEDVPLEFQSDIGMDYIQMTCNRTVKLQTKFISYGRERLTWYGGEPYPFSDEKYKGNTRLVMNGTGYIWSIAMFEHSPCRCKECKNSTHPVVGYMRVEVFTARHVVFDESECVHTRVEVFYDTPDKNGVVLLDGCVSDFDRPIGPDNDRIRVFCFTHDTDVMDKLKNKIGLGFARPRYIEPAMFVIQFKSGFIVSHPHGTHKQISFGQTRFSIHSFTKDHLEPEGFVRCRLKLNLPLIKRLFLHVSKFFREMEDKMLENVTSPSMVEPGVEYLLPDTSNICVPGGHHGAPFDRLLKGWWFVKWRDIIEDWGYKDSNGKIVPFPPGMEILCRLDKQYTVTYDIATCPGSSGARVYNFHRSFFPLLECIHSGADKVWGNKGIFRLLS